MVTMICWLVIHTSNDSIDNRRYEQFKGLVLKEYTESNQLSFMEAFTSHHIDTTLNNPIQVVSDNECSYAQ